MDTEATEPVGEPIEEVGRELPGPAMPCRLITPLRRIACASKRQKTTATTRPTAHFTLLLTILGGGGGQKAIIMGILYIFLFKITDIIAPLIKLNLK